MKVVVSAGEESGDLHGANLARALKAALPAIEISGMGGERMRAAGVEVVADARRHGVVGFVEVFGKFGALKADLDALTAAMRGAAAAVAVNYGGFNARFIARAKKRGLKTFYYIPPKLWAWGRGRSRALAQNLDLVLAVFPFEADYWRRAGAEATFVGHPLLDITKAGRSREDVRAALGLGRGEKFLLVLPGSRSVEIKHLWPPVALALATLVAARPEVKAFILPGGSFDAGYLARCAPVPGGVRVIDGPLADYVAAADAALAASGTVTLELAILGTPQVILYKVNQLTWEIGRRLVYVSHLGLPNILAGRPVVPELLQGDVRPALIAAETARVLDDEGLRADAAAAYDNIRSLLAPPASNDGRSAPERAAAVIAEMTTA